MKKIYQEPNVEFISLIPQEEITANDVIDGEQGLASNTLFG